MVTDTRQRIVIAAAEVLVATAYAGACPIEHRAAPRVGRRDRRRPRRGPRLNLG
jgi:hypothetical protein